MCDVCNEVFAVETGGEGSPPPRSERMTTTSIFRTLCHIADGLDSAVRSLEPGVVQDRFMVLLQRLDEAIDRTIGLEAATGPAEEER